MSRRVLIIAPFFPPAGGPGVQRWAKFVRYLPEFGYEPIVITMSEQSGTTHVAVDPSLTADTALAEVIRVPRSGSTRSPAASRFDALVNRPSQADRAWVEVVVSRALRVQAIDAAVLTLGPYALAEIATRFTRSSRIPLVVDFRDPWVLDEMWFLASMLHRAHDRRRMRRVVAAAAGLVLNTDEAARRFAESFRATRPTRVSVIPNGFDRADFEGLTGERGRDVFTILHTGTLHTETGLWLCNLSRARKRLAGISSELNVLSRSHVYLVQAVQRVIDDDPALAGRIRILLAGDLTEIDREITGRRSFVEYLGYRTHAETVQLMTEANALFLPLHTAGHAHRVAITPGKTYEYLASGTPIIAAVPESDARDILVAAGCRWIAYPDDVDALANHVRALVDDWRRGVDPTPLRPEVVSTYERRHLTRRLAGFLDDVIASAQS